MSNAYVNRIATSVPEHQVHDAFLRFARRQVADDRARAIVLDRMARRSGIERRFSVLALPQEVDTRVIDAEGFYIEGAFPSTAARLRLYERRAPDLAERAVNALGLGAMRADITHVLVTSCTGFSAPGIDLDIVERCGLPPDAERTVIGFMGCSAAINALKLARHIVQSDPKAKVLTVNLELCTLHLQETSEIEQLLAFHLFGDGCAAALVSAEPEGLALDRFHAVLAPGTRELITWAIGDSGFDMVLSGRVPAAIHDALSRHADTILDHGAVADMQLWAVHPGGRTVLDAVERALDLHPQALGASRAVLREYGNMSSATVMFVLERLMARARPGDRGCAMAFGPGLVAETMLFHAA